VEFKRSGGNAEQNDVKYFLMGISVILLLWAGTFFLMLD
jgi:hypothetical protein